MGGKKRPVPPGPGGATLRTAAGVKLDRLVMLDHDAGGKTFLERMGVKTRSDGTPVPDPDLQKRIEAAVKSQPETVGKAAFALFDLTKGGVRYAGHRDTEVFHPGSMGKLAIMLGAFQLRHDLRRLIADDAGKTIKDLDSLGAAAETRWAPALDPPVGTKVAELRPGFPGKPAMTLEGERVLHGGKPVKIKAPFDRVRLDRIFDATKWPKLEWRSDGLNYFQLYFVEKWQGAKPAKKAALLKGFGGKHPVKPPQLIEGDVGFWDRLQLMIGFSSNNSPRAIAGDISQAYIHSTLLRSGLFLPTVGGLWLGHPYSSGNVFLEPPVPGRKLSFEKAKGLQVPNATATALACATLVAAIFKGVVLDEPAREEVKVLLDKAYGFKFPGMPDVKKDPSTWSDVPSGQASVSPVAVAINDGVRGWNGDTKALKAHSKLGLIGDPEFKLDAAHIHHETDGGTIDFVLSVFDSFTATPERMEATARAVDLAVSAVNGVKRKER